MSELSKDVFDPGKAGKYVFQATIATAPQDVGKTGKLQAFTIEGSGVKIGVFKNEIASFGQPLEVGTTAEIEIEVKDQENSVYKDIKCKSFGGKKEKPRGGWGGGAAPKSEKEIVATLIASCQSAAAAVLVARPDADIKTTLDLFTVNAISAFKELGS